MSQETNWFHDQTTEEGRAERRSIRQWAFLAFCAICGLALLLLAIGGCASKAYADPVTVYSSELDGVRLRLLDSPCTDNTSLMLISTAPPTLRSGWKASSSDWRMPNGQWETFAGCWLLVPKDVAGAPDDVFVLVFADGATGQVLKRDLLKKKTGT